MIFENVKHIQQVNELGCKLAAGIFLSECKRSSKLLRPNEEEWVGINLLIRDDEIPSSWGVKRSNR